MSGNQRTLDRALAHHQAGELAKAEALYRQIVRVETRNARVLDLLAQILEAGRRWDEAIETRRQAVRSDPLNSSLRERLSRALLENGEPDQSIEVWKEASRLSNYAPAAMINQARFTAQARRYAEALEVLDKAAEKHPDNREILGARAALTERLGRTDEAAALFERVLASDPENIEANAVLARVEARAGKRAEAKARLERLIATPAGAKVGKLHTELALVLDKLKDYDGAFASASRGQAMTYAALLDQDRDGSAHEAVIRCALRLTREQVAAWPVPEVSDGAGPVLPRGVTAPPVFVVGFPRSGTTLVEQMLAAHPNLAVSDELPNLQIVRQKMYALRGHSTEYPFDLGGFSAKQAADGRKWYLERAYRSVPRASGGDGRLRRVVDKQPLNTADLCFVRLILPESPVIYVQRDPRDTVLSVFLQGFSRAVPHLFSLEGTARLYDLFAQVWQHYQAVLGLKTMIVRYEDLVVDPEREARRMVEFIGEAWDPAILNYHAPEHRRFVTTPSYADVSQPIYTRAMGRWKNYRKHLAPVLPVLEPWVKKTSYEPS